MQRKKFEIPNILRLMRRVLISSQTYQKKFSFEQSQIQIQGAESARGNENHVISSVRLQNNVLIMVSIDERRMTVSSQQTMLRSVLQHLLAVYLSLLYHTVSASFSLCLWFHEDDRREYASRE